MYRSGNERFYTAQSMNDLTELDLGFRPENQMAFRMFLRPLHHYNECLLWALFPEKFSA